MIFLWQLSSDPFNWLFYLYGMIILFNVGQPPSCSCFCSNLLSFLLQVKISQMSAASIFHHNSFRELPFIIFGIASLTVFTACVKIDSLVEGIKTIFQVGPILSAFFFLRSRLPRRPAATRSAGDAWTARWTTTPSVLSASRPRCHLTW